MATENRKSNRRPRQVDLTVALSGESAATCADPGIFQWHLNADFRPSSPEKKKRRKPRSAGNVEEDADVPNVGTANYSAELASTAAAGSAAAAPGTPNRPVLSDTTNTPSAPADHVLATAAAAHAIAPSSALALPRGHDGSTAAAVDSNSSGSALSVGSIGGKTVLKVRIQGPTIDAVHPAGHSIRVLVNGPTLTASLSSSSLNDEEEDTGNSGNALLNSPAMARRNTGAAGGHGGGRTGLGLPKDDRLYDNEENGGIGKAITTSLVSPYDNSIFTGLHFCFLLGHISYTAFSTIQSISICISTAAHEGAVQPQQACQDSASQTPDGSHSQGRWIGNQGSCSQAAGCWY